MPGSTVVHRLALVVVLVALTGVVACSSNNREQSSNLAESVHVSDAWVRPGLDPTAVYLSVTNEGDQAVLLTGADSTWAEQIAIHETVADDGFMMMQHVESIEVAPGSTVVFEPGGLHMMATGLKDQLGVGDSVEVTLLTGSGTRIDFTARVMALGVDSESMDDDSSHNH